MDTNIGNTFTFADVQGIFEVLFDAYGVQYLIVILILIALRIFAYRKWLWARILFWVIIVSGVIFTILVTLIGFIATAMAISS